jgi:hypothetical protein
LQKSGPPACSKRDMPVMSDKTEDSKAASAPPNPVPVATGSVAGPSETIAASTTAAKATKTPKVSLLKLCITLFVTGLTIGYAVGKAATPKYVDEIVLEPHLSYEISTSTHLEMTYNALGLPARAAQQLDEISCACGHTLYDFKVTADKPETRPIANGDDKSLFGERTGLTLSETLLLIFGETNTFGVVPQSEQFIDYVKSVPGGKKIKPVLYALVSTASGFSIGYMFGYQAEPKWDSDEIRGTLSKGDVWRRVVANIKTGTLTFEYSKDGTPVVHGEAYESPNIFHRESVLARPELGWLAQPSYDMRVIVKENQLMTCCADLGLRYENMLINAPFGREFVDIWIRVDKKHKGEISIEGRNGPHAKRVFDFVIEASKKAGPESIKDKLLQAWPERPPLTEQESKDLRKTMDEIHKATSIP